MRDLLGFPESPHTVFVQSPLTLALCQVRFASVLSVADPTFVAPFQRAIADRYPLALPSEQVDMEFFLGPSEAQFRKSEPFRQWRFSDTDDTWGVVLTHESIALETRAYAHFEDFLEQLRFVLDALIEHIKPAVGVRLGLRYINEIRLINDDLTSIIHHDLLGPLTVEGISYNLVQAIQELRLSFPTDEELHIRHGYLPLGTTVQPKSGDEVYNKPFYLLDYDAFKEFQPPHILPMTQDVICKYVAEYHQTIYQLFRWSVTEQYISTLGVHRNDSY